MPTATALTIKSEATKIPSKVWHAKIKADISNEIDIFSAQKYKPPISGATSLNAAELAQSQADRGDDSYSGNDDTDSRVKIRKIEIPRKTIIF